MGKVSESKKKEKSNMQRFPREFHIICLCLEYEVTRPLTHLSNATERARWRSSTTSPGASSRASSKHGAPFTESSPSLAARGARGGGAPKIRKITKEMVLADFFPPSRCAASTAAARAGCCGC